MTSESRPWFDFVDQEKWDKNSEKWIESLIDGGFEQADGVLHRVGTDETPDSFCCLGLGCHVARFKPKPDGQAFIGYGRRAETVLAPPELAVWLGFKVPAGRGKEYAEMFGDTDDEAFQVEICLDNPRRVEKGYRLADGEWRPLEPYESLAGLNDHDCTFEQIGKLIRKYNVRCRWYNG